MYKGKNVSYFDGDAEFYRKVNSKYLELKGWKEDIAKCQKYSDLPINVRIYIETIEKLVGVKVKYISTGASSDAVIRR